MYIFLTLVTLFLITVMFHCVIKDTKCFNMLVHFVNYHVGVFLGFFIVINHLRVSPGLPVVYHENYYKRKV